jgi:hypothetical protein
MQTSKQSLQYKIFFYMTENERQEGFFDLVLENTAKFELQTILPSHITSLGNGTTLSRVNFFKFQIVPIAAASVLSPLPAPLYVIYA